MYDSQVSTLDRPTDAIIGQPLRSSGSATSTADGAPGSLADVPLDDLVDDLRTWAAHITAAEAHWLDLVAEFCRREGHLGWGLASPAHWLAWQCSLSPGTAREHVRVALALQDLPVIRAHFAAGRISYSKVRAITRVADPDNERTLVRLALNGTAAQVEKTIAAWIGAINRDDPDREAVRHQRRGVTRRYNEYGNAVIMIETAPENSDRILDGIDEWLDDVEGPGPFDDASAAPAEKATLSQRRADAFMVLIDDRTGTRHGADRIRASLDIDLAALTHNADGTCQVRNGPSLSAETARRLTCDAELELFHTPIPATPIPTTGAPGCACGTHGHQHRSAPDGGEAGPNPLMEAHHITDRVAAAVARAIPEPVPVPEEARVTRTINRATRRAVARRDKGCCQFPGCDRARFTEIHHIIHWACGGDHTLANLTTLCGTHHRLVHEGGYRIAGNGNTPVFLRPDNTPMTITPIEGDATVIDRHGMALDLGPHTLSRGTGDRLQLHYTVSVLAERHPHTAIQTTKMTTATTTDLIQHNRPAPADHGSNSNSNSGGGDRSGANTRLTPTSPDVPAGTSTTVGSGCDRRPDRRETAPNPPPRSD